MGHHHHKCKDKCECQCQGDCCNSWGGGNFIWIVFIALIILVCTCGFI